MDFETILYEKRGHKAYLTLNRPEFLNAINLRMAEELAQAWRDVKQDDNVWVVVLSALHPLPVTEERWDQAAKLGFQLRRRGVSVPFTDLLIGAVAKHEGVTLLHRDRHFDLMAEHVGLKVESYVTA